MHSTTLLRVVFALAAAAPAGVVGPAPAVARPAPAVALSSPANSVPLAPSTIADLFDAMHGEALAHATYSAFADEADGAGRADIAALFRATANQERDEHFVEEAGFVDLVDNQAADLRVILAEEVGKSAILYPAYARQAQADGDLDAFLRFTELASDEAEHADLLRQVICALDRTCRRPTPPVIEPITIVPGPPTARGATLANITAALRGEAFDSARYRMHAAAVFRAGHGLLGEVLAALSAAERLDHFAQMASAAGLLRGTPADLADAIARENHEATVVYPSYVVSAAASSDMAVASRLTEIASDEARHRGAFAAAIPRS